MTIRDGSIFGSVRAETDGKMLRDAFVNSSDYNFIIKTDDYNFVVGRRGTGKSALFIKAAEYFEKQKNIQLFSLRIDESESLFYRSIFSEQPIDYRIGRAITKLAWEISLLMEIINKIKKYHLSKSGQEEFINQYKRKYGKYLSDSLVLRCVYILKDFIKKANLAEVPSLLIKEFDYQKLKECVCTLLSDSKLKVIFLFDQLDEGWIPDDISMSYIGGLAKASSEFMDQGSNILVILFIRDNIFRGLCHKDPDSSRNIEGNTLRLRWDVESLFDLACKRLKHSLNITQESTTKIWNHFACKDLKNREGFKFCLRYTLYRPRDLINLLNRSYITAKRAGRDNLIENDIEAASIYISDDRLRDLIKEYSSMFNGLQTLVKFFSGKLAVQPYKDILLLLSEGINSLRYESQSDSDFAILSNPEHLFNVLYSIGFLGVENEDSSFITFCHDGSNDGIPVVKEEQKVYVHPCYLKALNIELPIENEVYNEINDEYKSIGCAKHVNDARIKKIGKIVEDYSKIPLGLEGASDFESWSLNAIKVLFSGKVSNPQLHPNKDAVQRRDILGTNMGKGDFFSRILNDYKSRQLTFEVKNYDSLKPEDFRQCVSYVGNQHGSFIVIIYRSETMGLDDKERNWVKEMYDEHKVMIFLLPASLLSKGISKLRNVERYDYIDEQLCKRLDTFERQYVKLKSYSTSKNRHPKKKNKR